MAKHACIGTLDTMYDNLNWVKKTCYDKYKRYQKVLPNILKNSFLNVNYVRPKSSKIYTELWSVKVKSFCSFSFVGGKTIPLLRLQ